MKCVAAMALGLLLFSASFADDPPKKKPLTAAEELQRLQGTWKIESWHEDGKPLAAADLKKRELFFGANVLVIRRDGKPHEAGLAKIDPSASPRTIDFTVKQGEPKDETVPGIYEWDGDTLRIHLDPKNLERPEDFKPDAKGGTILIAAKKPKPEIPETIDIVGKYRSELVEASGNTVVTEANVERRGDGYIVTYTREGKLLFVGTALRRGEHLSMAWMSSGQVGVSVYKIERGPKLTGDYATLGGLGVIGREVLTPWKKID